MYITVHLEIRNRDLLFKSPKVNKIGYMIEEGWMLTNKNRGFFSTTYSFSKII